jgi:hypothetical protein
MNVCSQISIQIPFLNEPSVLPLASKRSATEELQSSKLFNSAKTLRDSQQRTLFYLLDSPNINLRYLFNIRYFNLRSNFGLPFRPSLLFTSKIRTSLKLLLKPSLPLSISLGDNPRERRQDSRE